MVCVYCGEKTRTVNSRGGSKGQQVWRRRKCLACNAIFTTNERPDIGLAIRVNAKNGLQPFSSEKLYLDVYDSLSHRKTAYTDAKQLSATIISKLIPCKSGLLDGDEIKQEVLQVLKRFDQVAHTHFRAHHP